MTMAYIAISTAVAVIGAGTSAYGSYVSAENAKEAADYNAGIEMNKAQDAKNIGANQAAETRQRARKIMSAQAEGASMSGVDINYGTPMGLLVETAGIGEKEALLQMNNAQRQAWGHSAQSQLDTIQGANAQRAGYINTTATALNGLSNAASSGFSTYKALK